MRRSGCTITELFRLCCAQAVIFWGQVVYSFRDSCAGNLHLHTGLNNLNAYAVLNYAFGRVVEPCPNRTLYHAYFSELTDVSTGLYPLYTPPITTTTKYINI